MNTTLETEVQTISRQLYAILVVKLEGKALGIAQSGNRQAALLRGILNPRAAWEADIRDGRSVVESLNRWEKTIGLNGTAEHSPESYQNILKQAPSNVRVSYNALSGWLREYAETLRRYDWTYGSSYQTSSTGPVPMDVDQISLFHV